MKIKKTILTLLIIMLLIIISLVITVIALSVQLQKEAADNNTLAAMAAANPREYIYPENTDVVTIKDSYLGEISIAALPNVPRAAYDYNNLKLESGRYKYVIDGITTSKTGVDVSSHNGDINWEAVKDDGIDFAMIRLGYRGYGDGALNLDSEFYDNIKGAQAAGLDVGVYFYTQAVSEAEALEEAEFVIQALIGYEITYPVAIDIEITEAEDVRANEVSGEMLTSVAEIFCKRIEEAEFKPMVYANIRMAYLKLDLRRLSKYDFWYAEYTDGFTAPQFYYDYQIWQYATDGRVNGIATDVDLNIAFENYVLTP
ncbi:MAG: glycoside hydrolase family 25 protein [Ruminococcus sp.]|jgi:GH25 family lysozyme M1 (1,4-beta-N-acetylmuramidase)|nr:glycoside hydrolase family 25 protein [Ruminococcus sp.]